MTNPKKIVVATKNKGKLKEIIKYFQPLGIQIVSMAEYEPLPEAIENGKTFEENALIKAKFYSKLIGLPCLADDSGLSVDALNGAPGVYSARFAGEHATDAENNQKLLRSLKELQLDSSPASYICSMVLYFPTEDKYLVSHGKCSGEIHLQGKGNGGFGYDPYFYLPTLNKTMAEISLEEKNSLSHRGAALSKMIKLYQEQNL